MVASNSLQVVLVTPEKTLLDESATSLRFPLEDGQIGILPNRAPMVGRLGLGELLITQGSTTKHFFIEGGFCQVKGSTVTILTNRAISSKDLNLSKIEDDLAKAESLRQDIPEQREKRNIELPRLKSMKAIAAKKPTR